MNQDVPVAAPAPVAAPEPAPAPAPAPVERTLPEYFVIKTTLANREGYALYRWTDAGNDNDNRRIHVLRPFRHGDLYYNIREDTTLPVDYTSVQTRKSQGNVVNSMKWKYTRSILIYSGASGNRWYPVIHITNMSRLPIHRVYSFIPIVTENPVQAPVAPVAPVTNQVQVTNTQAPKIYPITTIPQHAVRAFLRDAAMQEEICSITGDEIDITNGAMTSCFHLFEKNAIAMWLAMPNSRDKCPVCNAKCNMFTVDSPAQEVIVIDS
jgi:hypothetical protein